MSETSLPQRTPSEDARDPRTAGTVRDGSSTRPRMGSAALSADVPEAVRDAPSDSVALPRPPAWRQPWAIAAGVVAAIAVGGAALAIARPAGWLGASGDSPPETLRDRAGGTDAPAADGAEAPETDDPAIGPGDGLLGHLPYEEAPTRDLEPVTADGRIRLRSAAAERYRRMEEAARRDGIVLSALSGFRSLEEQQHLFFDIKAQRGQNASKRAEVSAPPGYSEHHTGYAIDIGDANVPATHLSPDFEKTAAFEWLEVNAARFSFELSFPRNNPQGIAYEPWHWRYVGDRESLELFYKGRGREASPEENRETFSEENRDPSDRDESDRDESDRDESDGNDSNRNESDGNDSNRRASQRDAADR